MKTNLRSLFQTSSDAVKTFMYHKSSQLGKEVVRSVSYQDISNAKLGHESYPVEWHKRWARAGSGVGLRSQFPDPLRHSS